MKRKRKGLPMGAAQNRLDDLFISDDEWLREFLEERSIFEYREQDTLYAALNELRQSLVELGDEIVKILRIYQIIDGVMWMLKVVTIAINEFKRIWERWIDDLV